MREEVRQQVGAAAQPPELASGLGEEFSDVGGQRVEQRVFRVPIALLLRVEVRLSAVWDAAPSGNG